MLLLTVLITGAVALAVSLQMALQSIGELDMGFAGSQAQRALALAEGCAGEALRRLRQDSSYAGGEMPLGGGFCTIAVSQEGTGQVIDVAATLDRWTRKVRVQIDLHHARMIPVVWEQVPD